MLRLFENGGGEHDGDCGDCTGLQSGPSTGESVHAHRVRALRTVLLTLPLLPLRRISLKRATTSASASKPAEARVIRSNDASGSRIVVWDPPEPSGPNTTSLEYTPGSEERYTSSRAANAGGARSVVRRCGNAEAGMDSFSAPSEDIVSR